MSLSSKYIGVLGALAMVGASKHVAPPAAVSAEVAEWRVTLSTNEIPAGPVTFTVKNAATMTHGFEVEGKGIERRAKLMPRGGTATLSLDLAPGTYEVYCPVGEGAHKRMGMLTHLTVRKVP
jgi:plastocyanin